MTTSFTSYFCNRVVEDMPRSVVTGKRPIVNTTCERERSAESGKNTRDFCGKEAKFYEEATK